MSSSWKTILRDYASNPDPTTIPRTRYLNHNDKFLTIIDCYPKAMYHLLVLPRVRPGWTAEQLLDLRTVMKNQERAKELMTDLKKYADEMEKVMENEMEGRWNFKWDINKGFHPNPSMDHLHLHIISNDLCGEWLKKKKHYNSFNPKRGFWVPLRKVLNWCKINVPFSYEKETNWLPSQYNRYLTEEMFCHQCGENGIQTMPGIIAHLKMHWDKTVEDETAKYERRVKFEAYVARKRARAEAQAQQAGTSKDAEKASTSKDGEEVGTSKDAKEADTSESAVAAETAGASGNTDDSDDAESEQPKAKRQRTEEKSDGDAALFEAVD